MNPQPQQLYEKQQFLREQILDKNFNAQDFIQYLNKQLNIDSDINKCSMRELKRIVGEYVGWVRKDQIHQSQFQESKIDSITVDNVQDKLKYGKPVTLSRQPLVVEEAFQEIVKCCKIDQKYTESEIKSKKFHCTLSSPERKFITSIFGINTSSYLQFRIKTTGLNWQVGRRYSDFIWLRSTLRRFYPSSILPPIPNKKAHKRSPRQLTKRMSILQLFLNDLLSFAEFINSKYLQAFLSYPSQKFQKFRKQIDVKKCFQSINTTQTLDGTFKINFNRNVHSFVKELPKWIQQSQGLLKELTRSSKQLKAGVVTQVNTLYGMADQLAKLHQYSDRMHGVQQRQDSGFFKIKSIFVTLNNMVVQWGNIWKNQIELIQTNCNVIFKYVRQSLSGFRQLLQQTNTLQQSYIAGITSLNIKKQKLFLLKDMSRWQLPQSSLSFIPSSAIYSRSQSFNLMLPKQSSLMQKQKHLYCYYLSRIYEGVSLSLDRMAIVLCENMEIFTIKQKVLTQHMGEVWGEMAGKFTKAFCKDVKLEIKMQHMIIGESQQLENQYSQSVVDKD